ncbi:MAG: hypothetical protein A4E40_00869 [Methanoregulaceae archaeon PtaU1.Bin059]|nr:MAG: hypothetical protein A4E39_00430 [Methanoregulaceae archaeon PtaB.Bin152]OPY40290.1 MAG: hypothetical protein A4E40_00869 [Methanoregulaceae archaeon PtaU1.Bin059]
MVNTKGGVRLNTYNHSLFWLLVMIVICSPVMAAGASGYPALKSIAVSLPTEDVSPQVTADANAHLGTISYYLWDRTTITKHIYDDSMVISVPWGSMLVWEVTGKVDGDPHERGMILVYDMMVGAVTDTLLLKPNRWATLTTNPGFYVTADTGVEIVVIAPDGDIAYEAIMIDIP